MQKLIFEMLLISVRSDESNADTFKVLQRFTYVSDSSSIQEANYMKVFLKY